MSFSLHRGHADKEWGENIITCTLTTFLRPSMHFGPWSSTGSHSLGQSTALSTSTTMDTCWASLRSWFFDSMSSLICRGRGRVSASSWSIAKVKLNLPLMHVQFTCKCMLHPFVGVAAFEVLTESMSILPSSCSPLLGGISTNLFSSGFVMTVSPWRHGFLLI